MPLYALTAIFLAQLATLKTHGAFQAECAADFQLLCMFAALEDTTPKAAEIEEVPDAEIQDIRTMNMSAAAADWQKLFAANGKDLKWADVSKGATAEPYQTHWSSTFDGWVADRKRLDETKGGQKWLDLNPPPKTQKGREAAAEKLNKTLDSILKLKASYDRARTEVMTTFPAQAKSKVLQALYGEGATEAKLTTDKTIAHASTYASACGANGGLSVYGDIMCICGDTSSANSAVCTNTNINLKWNSAVDDSSIAAAKAKCTTKAKTEYTAATLTALIATLSSRLRHEAKSNELQTYLGKTNGQTCAGTGNAACVIYSKYFDDGAPEAGTQAIPWVSRIAAAAALLEQAETKAAEAKSMRREIETLIQNAKAAYKSKRYDFEAAPNIGPQTETKDSRTLANKCEKHHASPDNCTKAECDYDTENKKCKSKTGTENPAAGTGAAKEGEKDKCSEAKTPEDCAKVTGTKPEGKAAVCGWIDYIDGKGKVEPACRSSSFLVSKKLGLIDAAFVALLF
uniref:Variant surface glycoprotein n=1 Tax=Trypanosoma brucei TaxID=5691 RepID=S5FVN2_9TRYP|nr:variant surface glycoprotein [Trypanosoma brucei]